MGYGDVRANKSRVHTRITEKGTTVWDYYYMGTKLGLRWGPRLVFDTRC